MQQCASPIQTLNVKVVKGDVTVINQQRQLNFTTSVRRHGVPIPCAENLAVFTRFYFLFDEQLPVALINLCSIV